MLVERWPSQHQNPIPGASSLNFDSMESLGLLCLPLMELLVAAHLHLKCQLSAVSYWSPCLPSKSDRFQSGLTEQAYKVAALSARALNILSLLMAYQAELCEYFGQTWRCGRRYRSSPTCASVFNAAQSRLQEECWGPWFNRNVRGGLTL